MTKSWRQWTFAVFLAWSPHLPVFAQGYDPEIQRSFIEGARLLEAGQLEAAARTFRELLKKTDAPRIKLELARTLFLLKEYGESRALFREVMLEPEIPWRVRDNIEAFIRRIDDIEGYVKFSVSLVSDTNPRNITSQREFTIGGIRLTFLPPQDNERVTGLRYTAQAFKPLVVEEGFAGYLVGSYLDYPSSALDRLTVDFGLMKNLAGEAGPRVRAGVEGGTFGDKRLYEFPYVGYLQPLSHSAVHSVNAEWKLGKVNFPHFGYLDAEYISGTLSGFVAASQTVALSLSSALEDSRAREEPYSYYGATVTPGIAWLVIEPALLLKADLALGGRRYAAPDPFFGEQRRDRKARLDFRVRSKQWRWMNLSPAAVVSVEKNRSNIGFYGYEKVNFSVELE